MDSILDVQNVTKRFGEVVALRDGNLSVARGEVHALIGANGAGKSTLIKILTGALKPNSGRIDYDGRSISLSSPAAARRMGLVAVYQEPSLVPDLTVAQNERLSSVDPGEVDRWIGKLSDFEISPGLIAGEMSLSAQRVVDLARALACNPKLLILDEVTAVLPADLSERVFAAVRGLAAAGVAVIIISHRLAELTSISQRATVLRDGKTVGVLDAVKGNEERIIQMMLGEPAAPAAAPAGETTVPAASGPRPAGGEGAFVVDGLAYRTEVNGVSLRIKRGEILGLVGQEGQGQDELVRCLSGFLKQEAGTVSIDNIQVKPGNPYDSIDRGIVLVPGDRKGALFPQRSIHENVAIAMNRTVRTWGLLPLRSERAKLRSVIEKLRIDTRAQAEVQRLSGGNQQKVVIARWLASGFKVLLCFDPTQGVDIETKHYFYSLLRELAGEGVSILYYTSELQEIPAVCDRVLVMYEGKIVSELPGREASESALLRASHGLVSGAPAK